MAEIVIERVYMVWVVYGKIVLKILLVVISAIGRLRWEVWELEIRLSNTAKLWFKYC